MLSTEVCFIQMFISPSHTHTPHFMVSSLKDFRLIFTPLCPTPARVSNIYNFVISNISPQVPFSFNHVPLSFTPQLTTQTLHFSFIYGIQMLSQYSKPTHIHNNTIFKFILQHHNNRNTSTSLKDSYRHF